MWLRVCDDAVHEEREASQSISEAKAISIDWWGSRVDAVYLCFIYFFSHEVASTLEWHVSMSLLFIMSMDYIQLHKKSRVGSDAMRQL